MLFNADARAVLVSPSVEKFLGGRADELRGKRVSEIFPGRSSVSRSTASSMTMRSSPSRERK